MRFGVEAGGRCELWESGVSNRGSESKMRVMEVMKVMGVMRAFRAIRAIRAV